MKKLLFLLPLFVLFFTNSSAQASLYVCVNDDTYQEVTATNITVSADGSTFYCSGNVLITNISNPEPDDPGAPKPKCGGNTGWACGVPTITTDGDITIVRCVGSTRRCAKAVNPN